MCWYPITFLICENNNNIGLSISNIPNNVADTEAGPGVSGRAWYVLLLWVNNNGFVWFITVVYEL